MKGHRYFTGAALGALLATLLHGGAVSQQAPAAGHDTPVPPPAAATPANGAAEGTSVTAAITRNVMVTDEMLRGADRNLNDWLLTGRTHDNQRYSPLTQINKANVRSLRPVAIIQTGIANSFEATPVVVNGIMYVAAPGDVVFAYDAVTGDPKWVWRPPLRTYTHLCCGVQSRGVTVAYGRIYVAMLDATIVALDARNGAFLWRTDVASTLPENPQWYSFTQAPQVYDHMVVVGSAGAEYPTRGFVQAYDADSGRLLWRFRTTAGPGEPGASSWKGDSWKFGGGSVWNTPAVDLKNNIVSFATGNPNPDIYGDRRAGDNYYTSGMVGLNARTGKFAWFHQQVPHDVWDYDSAAPVILMDAMDAHGKMVPAAAEASKNGFVDIVNRLDGTLLRRSEGFVLHSRTFMQQPPLGVENRIIIYPASNGGSQWSPAAYSPRTHQFYVMGVNEASYYSATETEHKEGDEVAGQIMGGRLGFIFDGRPENTISPSGTLSAVNVNTGKIDWQYKASLPMVGGVLATAGGLVFAGELDGHLDAFDANTGRKLWNFNLGVSVGAPPITYRVNGVQYVAVAAGGLSANGWARLNSQLGRTQYGDVVAIFALTGR